MERIQGIGPRIAQALARRGYWKKGRPDVMRFAADYRYVYTYVYRWIRGDDLPSIPNLLRLSKDLEVSINWLLEGDDGPAALTASGGNPAPTDKRRRQRPFRNPFTDERGALGMPSRGIMSPLPSLTSATPPLVLRPAA